MRSEDELGPRERCLLRNLEILAEVERRSLLRNPPKRLLRSIESVAENLTGSEPAAGLTPKKREKNPSIGIAIRDPSVISACSSQREPSHSSRRRPCIMKPAEAACAMPGCAAATSGRL